MRATVCVTLLLTLASCVLAQSARQQKPEDTRNDQTAYCPQTHRLEAEPSEKFFLDGSIGERHVRMYLDRGGSGVVGLFFDIGRDWDITLLGGTWSNGEIDASDAGENHPATGHLRASLADNRMAGTWTAEDSDQAESVELNVIPEPSCDGKEEWKHFDDPAWPVSFSYPASWHLEKSGNTITLTCPNPKEIAFDSYVMVHAGSGDFKGPTGLLQCGNKWTYGFQCDCDHLNERSCHEAKVSHSESATLLDVSDQEFRIYCRAGGYVAQGDGVDRIVLLPHAWAEVIADLSSSEIVDRLIATIGSDRKLRSAPVDR